MLVIMPFDFILYLVVLAIPATTLRHTFIFLFSHARVLLIIYYIYLFVIIVDVIYLPFCAFARTLDHPQRGGFHAGSPDSAR